MAESSWASLLHWSKWMALANGSWHALMAQAPAEAMLLLSWMLSSDSTSPALAPNETDRRDAGPTEQGTAVMFMSNHPVFTKAVVPRLREAAGRFVVVSSVAEVGEYCKELGCDYIHFPTCENAMRFAAICKEQPAYAAEVEKTYEVLKEWKPDVMITCGFFVLPPRAVKIPSKVALNLHNAKLPLYRGGVAYQAQILRGEPTFECCVHVMTDVIDDARDVLVRSRPLCLEGKTTLDAIQATAEVAPQMILDALHMVLSDEVREPEEVPTGDLPHAFGVKKQTWTDAAGVRWSSNCGVLSRVRIEWSEDTAVDIERASRAFNVRYHLFTDYQGRPFRVDHCMLQPEATTKPPGQILWASGRGEDLLVGVATCDGRVVLLRGQLVDGAAPVGALEVGSRFESVTLVSDWLKYPNTDRLPGGLRYC